MGETFGAWNVFEAPSPPTWEGAHFGGAPFLLVVTLPRALFSFPLTATHGRGPLFRGQGVMEGHGEKQTEAHVTCSGKYSVVVKRAKIPSAATWLLFERCDLPKWQMETETLH